MGSWKNHHDRYRSVPGNLKALSKSKGPPPFWTALLNNNSRNPKPINQVRASRSKSDIDDVEKL